MKKEICQVIVGLKEIICKVILGQVKSSVQGASLSLYIGSHLALNKKIYEINNQTFGSFRKSV